MTSEQMPNSGMPMSYRLNQKPRFEQKIPGRHKIK